MLGLAFLGAIVLVALFGIGFYNILRHIQIKGKSGE